MTYARPHLTGDLGTIPRMPSWVTAQRGETPEDVAFLSGAALNHLHLVVSHLNTPHALWRERLALQAAETCVAISGRPERARELRDAIHLLRPGDLPGPAGDVYLAWRRAVERALSVKALHRALAGALPVHAPDQIATWLDAGAEAVHGNVSPIAQACTVLETVLAQAPREEAMALILADAALATALGWDHGVPLLEAGLKRRDLRKTGEALRLACHRAVILSAGEAVRMAVDLTRRAEKLRAVAPKLRAKGAGEAVEMFLTRDAVTPAALPLLDRAARRLCDRLVDLGAIRELTGRDTFRLYGV